MAYNRFTIGISIRLFFIFINLTVIAFLFKDVFEKEYIFLTIIILVILILQIIELQKKVTITNTEISRFLSSIIHSDTSINFYSKYLNNSFADMNEQFEKIISIVKSTKIEKEIQYNFLKTIINHVHAGIIVIDYLEKISHINSTAKIILYNEFLIEGNYYNKLPSEIVIEINNFNRNISKLIELNIQNEKITLTFSICLIKIVDKPYRIITFQNIKEEITRKESEAWLKLIRILTHEIMNTATPLSSLTETLLMIIEKEEGAPKDISELSNETISDIHTCIRTIQKRSNSLYNFVQDYRKLTRIPIPKPEPVSATDLIKSVYQLMKAEADKRNANLTIALPNIDFIMNIDSKLIEQVIINLLTNSLQAVSYIKHGEISLQIFETDTREIIQIIDNGEGISKENLEQIFIPFFTTKENGSGIGLSLSRQIMLLHGGSIQVFSEPNKKTIFELSFPKMQQIVEKS